MGCGRFGAENIYPGIGDGATFLEQYRILMEQTDAEIVYFCRRRLLLSAQPVRTGVNFLRQNATAHFVSAYDHPDLHTTEIARGPS